MINWKYLVFSLIGKKINRQERLELYINNFRSMGVIIGKNVDMYDVSIDSLFPFLVEIEDDCIITGGVKILAHDASLGMFIQKYKVGKVKIHKKVFIGMDTIIMPGVEIGPNTIIGANSVVTRSIPPNSVAAGIPAKVISTLDEYLYKYNQGINSLNPSVITVDSPKLPLKDSDIDEFRESVRKNFDHLVLEKDSSTQASLETI